MDVQTRTEYRIEVKLRGDRSFKYRRCFGTTARTLTEAHERMARIVGDAGAGECEARIVERRVTITATEWREVQP